MHPVTSDNGQALDLPPTALDHTQVVREQQEEREQEEDYDEEDDDVELVHREEGQPDPRDMLRAQLRRSESVGRQGKLNRVASSTIGEVDTVDGVDLGEFAPWCRLRASLTRPRSSTSSAEITLLPTEVLRPFLGWQAHLYYVSYSLLSAASHLLTTFLRRSDPDEEEATGYVGVMQAIISIFADEKDKLRCV